MAKVEGFTQTAPVDGHSASQRTEAYLGYDSANLYVVFVAFDDQPPSVRARRVSRESTDGDDLVTVTLDTFDDRRRGYGFTSNPFGIQSDFLETDERGRDATFDTVWESKGTLTEGGYVVLMAIPFKSLRFPSGADQRWGLLLERWVAGAGEQDFWPRVTTAQQSRLAQSAELTGMSGVTAGKNMQFIPYVSLQSAKTLDVRDTTIPTFDLERAKLNAGLDAKFVLGSSLVLDMTLNPDFGQVESDDPRASANERFELFRPEKRPFFIENSDYFQTPLDLIFTRRIVDPSVGLRLSGKVGPYGIGAFAMDDDGPGEVVADSDPAFGSRAGVFGLRVTRDVFNGSKVGALVTDRELGGGHNRVAAADARIRFDENWSGLFQAAESATLHPDGTAASGSAFRTYVSGTGRSYHYEAGFRDVGRAFETDLGFVPRADYRALSQYGNVTLRPENAVVISVSPRIFQAAGWDHEGTKVYSEVSGGVLFELRKQTTINVWYNAYREWLRPTDYDVLSETRRYSSRNVDVFFTTRASRVIAVSGDVLMHGTAINYNPGPGREPELATRPVETNLTATVSPLAPLRIDATYLLTHLRDREGGNGIFVNHILRTKWNWQFTRELSLRTILQWDSLNRAVGATSLEPHRRAGANVLLAYQVNPWTAFYAGYNGNLENLALEGQPGAPTLVRSPNGLLTTSRQFFVKFSYLLRI